MGLGNNSYWPVLPSSFPYPLRGLECDLPLPRVAVKLYDGGSAYYLKDFVIENYQVQAPSYSAIKE